MLYQTQNPHGGDIYGEEVLLDFSANTNPLGTPKGILDAVTAALPQMHRYPDPYCRKLVQAITEFEGVPKEYILCGNGAAELIYAYCDALRPVCAVELAPTFSEYALGLVRSGSRILRYRLTPENDFELTGDFLNYLSQTKPQAVFLCNPNNPTGRTIHPALLEDILAFCKRLDISLFVDECFLDLADAGGSLVPLLAEHRNLLILKAFTKSYGMAGIRLGYCMTSNTALLTRMSQCTQPWNVSLLAQTAGIAALQEQEFLKKTKALIAPERQWLKEALERRGFHVCPSDANYLLFRADPALHGKLKEKKIAIRNCSNYDGLELGWYRIAVRRREENEMLIRAIKEV